MDKKPLFNCSVAELAYAGVDKAYTDGQLLKGTVPRSWNKLPTESSATQFGSAGSSPASALKRGSLIPPNSVELVEVSDGKPCIHPGCLLHHSHPCEVCKRIAGRGTAVYDIAFEKRRRTMIKEPLKEFLYMSVFVRKKKPVDAIQWLKQGDHPKVTPYGESSIDLDPLYAKCGLLETSDGYCHIVPGDWILKDEFGNYFPCKEKTFNDKYEPA